MTTQIHSRVCRSSQKILNWLLFNQLAARIEHINTAREHSESDPAWHAQREDVADSAADGTLHFAAAALTLGADCQRCHEALQPAQCSQLCAALAPFNGRPLRRCLGTRRSSHGNRPASPRPRRRCPCPSPTPAPEKGRSDI